MGECAICGDQLAPGAKSCATCGTAVLAPVNPASGPRAPDAPPSSGPSSPSGSTLDRGASADANSRECPECHARYDAGYADEFCRCGAALEAGAAGTAVSTPSLPDVAPSLSGSALDPIVAKPPAGTVCLVVYSADRQPVLYYPLDKDVTLIGRSDPVRGDFPDLDLGSVLEPEASRRVSRKHALLLRSRETGAFTLRPLAKNTGTQIERDLAEDLRDYPLKEGTRIVLGGTVRAKVETIQ